MDGEAVVLPKEENKEMRCPWALVMGDTFKCIRSSLEQIDKCDGETDNCPLGANFISYDPDLPMYISEIYPAISGEGGSQGKVCTIVRTVGCNLRCRYCDTVYAYEGGDKVSTQNIVDAVLKFGIPTVLFTGGEPLLDRAIALNFLQAMFENEIKVYVETNGSIDIRPFVPLALIVMDIKCPSSGTTEWTHWTNVLYLKIDDEIKFVVANREDYEYAKSVIEEHDLSQRNLFISPVWPDDDREFFRELAGWMIVDKSPAKLSLQQHKVIWGPVERGV